MAKTKIFREYDGQNFVDPADAPKTVRTATPGNEASVAEYAAWKSGGWWAGDERPMSQADYMAKTKEVPSIWAGGEAQKPNWIDGTSTSGQATVGRRAPIVPIQSAILVQEDQSSADTKNPLGYSSRGSKPVIDRTTGRLRTEEEELKRRTGGAILLG